MKKIESRRNLCQSCFQFVGRFILDCFCIICEKCFEERPPKKGECNFCGKKTRGNKIDTKDEKSVNKMSYLFENAELSLGKMQEVLKFQNEASNKYIEFLENDLENYKKAVKELIIHNPKLFKYFA